MDVINFNEYRKIPLELGGALPKIAIWYKDNVYMIKEGKLKNNIYQKSYIAEYIAAKLANSIGIECQEVILGIYDDKPVCGCRLFTQGSFKIHPYKDIRDSSLYTSVDRSGYALEEVIKVISNYKNFTINSEEHLDRFMLMTCFDALIGNSDRHWGNWGFIGNLKEYVSLSPLYDNGNSIASFLSEKKMKKALNLSEKDFIKQFVMDTPISQIKLNKERQSFYNIFRVHDFKKYTSVIRGNLNYVDISKSLKEDEVLKNFCTEIEIEFFIKYIEIRYEYFIGGKIYE
ncbi:MAG: HipA domain-containing protein [Romboutsia sp.]